MSHNILFPGTEQNWGDVWEHVDYLNSSYDYTLEYHAPNPFQVPSSPTIDFVCGIGTAPTPPNDPDVNNSSLTAVSARNGIFLQWSYPHLHPELVSFTEIYRSTSNDFGGAGVVGRNSADNFTDELKEEQKDTRFYYWVRHVSIHGTWSDPIGPASAVWAGSIDDILEHLNNLIDDSHLDQHLRDSIDRITDISSGLSEEEQGRLFGDSILTQMVQEIAGDLEAIDTRVGTQITQIQTENIAIAAKIELVLAKFEENIAAVLVETYALAEADRVAAGRIETVEGALTDPDTGELFVVAVQEQKIVELGTQYEDHEGQLQDLYGQWSIKVDANGYVSGVGLRSSPTHSEFIINANIFALGHPEGESLYDQEGNRLDFARPFIVRTENVGGQIRNTVAMDANVYIRNGTVKNAQIGEFIQSDDWNWNDGDYQGWRIDKNGNAFFDNLTAKGDITARRIEADAVDIIDTLMLRGQAVTIPAAASTPIQGQEIGTSQTLTQRSLSWPSPAHRPQAFIVNGLFGLNGSNAENNSAAPGTASIYLSARWLRPDGTVSSHNYGGYGVSFYKGYGGTVQAMWPVSPPGTNFVGVTFIISGACTSPRTAQGNAVLSIFGAKR